MENSRNILEKGIGSKFGADAYKGTCSFLIININLSNFNKKVLTFNLHGSIIQSNKGRIPR